MLLDHQWSLPKNANRIRSHFRLIQIDQEWVPHSESSSLYIRPTMIGTEATLGVAPAHEAELFVILSPVGPYFSTGVKPVNLVSVLKI